MTVTGYVKDVRDYLAMGTVVTLPLRMEYGHRGRIFEIMAMGIPIVATPEAIKGMDIGNSDGILIEQSPLSFAQAVLHVLNNRGYADQLGMQGRKAAVERFSHKVTYGRLADLLSESV